MRIFIYPWASYQLRKIAGCACAGNVGSVFPRRRFQRKPQVSDPSMHHGTCVHARAVMHGGIAYPRWRGKRSRHSRRTRTRNFTYLARGPLRRHDFTMATSVRYERKHPKGWHCFNAGINSANQRLLTNRGKLFEFTHLRFATAVSHNQSYCDSCGANSCLLVLQCKHISFYKMLIIFDIFVKTIQYKERYKG